MKNRKAHSITQPAATCLNSWSWLSFSYDFSPFLPRCHRCPQLIQSILHFFQTSFSLISPEKEKETKQLVK